MRTIVRAAIVTVIAMLAFLATPAAQPGQIISRFSGGWLVGAASDGSAVYLGADGVEYLKVAPGGAISYVNGATVTWPTPIPIASSTCDAPALSATDDPTLGIAIDSLNGSVLICDGSSTPVMQFNSSDVTIDATESLGVGSDVFTVFSNTTMAAMSANTSGIGTTVQTGSEVANSTAAAAGAQQQSPSFDWIGQGWKTNVTAGSREVRFYSYVLPVQGSVLPSGTWRLGAQINSGARTDLLEVTSGGTVNVLTSTGLLTAGNQVGYNLSAYGVGTAYAFTNSAAAIDFGTTDPAIVLDKTGTYQICGQVHVAYAGATVAAETATVKVRRTNNTATDLSAVVVIDLPVSTTLTHSYGTVDIPCFFYVTAATDDAITLFANVSATLGAGTINATAIGTSITAVRLY